jgi:peptidoglycan hydrolase-like protein with peptidoglycan-binding domain
MVVAALQQTSPAQAPAPPVPPLPARPGAATGAAAAQNPANIVGDPIVNAGNAARDGAVSIRNAVAEMRDDLRAGLRDGLQGEAGTTQPTTGPRSDSPIPPEVIPIVAIVFGAVVIMTIFGPIVRAVIRAFERRFDRKVVPAVEVVSHLKQLQASLDTMAIEVERISEAQRFQAKLLAERENRGAIPPEARGGA